MLMLMTFGGNRCSVFSHSLTAFPHLLPPTVSAPWALSTWTQGDQSVIKGSLLQVLKTSGILFLSSKINHLFHFNWSAADPYWIIRTIFARMSMNDSETVALIGDYRLQYRKYGLTMNITLDNTFERVFHVFRCLNLNFRIQKSNPKRNCRD